MTQIQEHINKLVFCVTEIGSAQYLLPFWEKHFNKIPIIANELLKEWCRNQKLEFDFNPNLQNFEFLITSATENEIERIAVESAKSHNLQVIQFFDQWFNLEKRSLDDVDFSFVIDEENKEIIEDAIVIGQPAFEKVQMQSSDHKFDRMVYIEQPIEQYYGNSLGYTEMTLWKSLLELKEKLPKLYFIPHPATKTQNEYVPEEEFIGFTLNSKYVVGAFSSLMISAYLNKCQVISYQEGLVNKNLDQLSKKELIPLITSREELENWLQRTEVFDTSSALDFTGSLSSFEKSLTKILEER